jgi:hypothetical protein
VSSKGAGEVSIMTSFSRPSSTARDPVSPLIWSSVAELPLSFWLPSSNSLSQAAGRSPQPTAKSSEHVPLAIQTDSLKVLIIILAY